MTVQELIDVLNGSQFDKNSDVMIYICNDKNGNNSYPINYVDSIYGPKINI